MEKNGVQDTQMQLRNKKETEKKNLFQYAVTCMIHQQERKRTTLKETKEHINVALSSYSLIETPKSFQP